MYMYARARVCVYSAFVDLDNKLVLFCFLFHRWVLFGISKIILEFPL